MKKLFQKKADWPYEKSVLTLMRPSRKCSYCLYILWRYKVVHLFVPIDNRLHTYVYIYIIGSGMNVHWLKGKQCTHILKNGFDTCRLLGLPESKQYGILLYKILYWLQHKSIQYWLLSFDDLLLARPFPYLSFPRWAWRIKLSRGIQQYQSWHQVWIASCCC